MILAKTEKGAFYAVQTLLQLMPAEVFSTDGKLAFPIPVQGAEIYDEPRFAYRGMHLDVGRNFFDVDAVKRYLDLMAMHKYNKFHWHLTEDQGWRIEIKKYPKLTEIGGFRKETVIDHASVKPAKYDGKRYGGFYTQDEVKEIVAYAGERFIEVIPEIELPGHAQAAIAAYPELGCLDEPLEVRTIWGVSENVYCPKEETFEFLENVIDEVIALFPSKYFHIGGDECPKKQWEENEFCQALIKKEGLKDEHELQSYFIKRIEKYLNSKGKNLVGWDEILEGGLAPNATVMSWRGMKGGIEAANEGHDVIMTPTSHCYFDYYNSLNANEPLAIGGYLPVEKVYSFEPIPPAIANDKRHHIIGAQANLWTEYIPTLEHLEYMTYPRGAAMAEVVWSDTLTRNYDNFSKRLTYHFKRFDALDVNTAQSFFDVNGKVVSENGQVKVSLISKNPKAEVRYTLDGTAPTYESTTYTSPFEIKTSSDIQAVTFVDGVQKGNIWKSQVHLHKAVDKPITVKNQPAKRYSGGGIQTILNGIYGNDNHFGDTEWLGFEGQDMEAVIDLGEETAISQVKCRFFKSNGSWIYLPKKMSVYTSIDGKKYELAGETEDISTDKKVAQPIVKLDAKAKFVKVVVNRLGIIPEGLTGAGYEAWLFVGELEVN